MMTKEKLLEEIENLPMDGNVEDVLFHHILNTRTGGDFRAEQMKTVIENRIAFLKSGLLKPNIPYDEQISNKAKIKIYEDCLNILKKEFFELNLPYDINLERKLHDVKETIVDKIYPIDDRMRGTREYWANQKKAGEVADVIEPLCYEMFNHGYNYFLETRDDDEKDYCDFETCIALKAIGYPLTSKEVINEDKAAFIPGVPLYSAQKWLRKHGVIVGHHNNFTTHEFKYYISTWDEDICESNKYTDYEDALADGIKEATRLIINKQILID